MKNYLIEFSKDNQYISGVVIDKIRVVSGRDHSITAYMVKEEKNPCVHIVMPHHIKKAVK